MPARANGVSMSAPRVFISHKSTDKPWTERLARSLRERGIDSWLDKWEIQPGDSILGKIREGISDSEFMVLVLTPDSVAQSARWVAEEWQSFRTRQLGGAECKLLTVLLRDTEIPPILNNIMYVDFRSEHRYNPGVEALCRVIFGESNRPPLGGTAQKKPYVEYVRRGTEAVLKLAKPIDDGSHRSVTKKIESHPDFKPYGIISCGHTWTSGGIINVILLSTLPIPEEVILRVARSVELEVTEITYESGETRMEKAH